MEPEMTLAQDNYTDGNALAGPLREIFAIDLTMASGRCAGCGLTSPVATLRLYDHAPGMVARCPSCDAVVLRLVRGPGRVWLDLHGMVYIEMPM